MIMRDKTMPTILIVDDHLIICDGLKNLLSENFEIIGAAHDGRDAVKMAKKLQPDVIVMDLTLPLLNGIEATRHIHAILPNIKIIILTMHNDLEYMVNSFDAGACGYLLKDCAVEELAKAIDNVLKGEKYFPKDIMRNDKYKKKFKKRSLSICSGWINSRLS